MVALFLAYIWNALKLKIKVGTERQKFNLEKQNRHEDECNKWPHKLKFNF
jgi:hypothetical protein